jgi:hypothetical protein
MSTRCVRRCGTTDWKVFTPQPALLSEVDALLTAEKLVVDVVLEKREADFSLSLRYVCPD